MVSWALHEVERRNRLQPLPSAGLAYELGVAAALGHAGHTIDAALGVDADEVVGLDAVGGGGG